MSAAQILCPTIKTFRLGILWRRIEIPQSYYNRTKYYCFANGSCRSGGDELGFQLESSPILGPLTTNSKQSKHPRDVNVDWSWRAYFLERAWNSLERDLSANSVESIHNIKLALVDA